MLKLEVKKLRCLMGMSGTLAEKTAIAELTLGAPIQDWALYEQKIARNFARQEFFPHPMLWDLAAETWLEELVPVDGNGRGIADWVLGLTILFQRMGAVPVLRGSLLDKTDGGCKLAIPYEREDLLRTALQFALKYLWQWLAVGQEALADATTRADLMRWVAKCQRVGMHPVTQRFALAAKHRGIPLYNTLNILQLGYGSAARKLNSSLTDATSNLGVSIAKDKFATSRFLATAGFQVPAIAVVASLEQAYNFVEKFGWPVVVKPKNLDQGLGVVPGIGDQQALQQAFEAALRLTPAGVIIEKHIVGDDYRLLVVGGKMAIATRRRAGGVIGDGMHSVAELVALENHRSARTQDERGMLIALSIDAEALVCLARQQLTAASVPVMGQCVTLRRIANISAGGTALDVTAKVHPDNKYLVERAARVLGLDIAGVDFLCPDITQSWKTVGGAICEVNAQPGLRVHWLGAPGRDINGEIIDWLFRAKSARIPTTAITGTNGKSTTAQMLHHIWLAQGVAAGVCTTQGVWIEKEQIRSDNLSGFPGAKILLTDPTVAAAVIELPRKGLIYFGHPCDKYDVGALLNIQNDHIGEDGVQSLEAMAQLKAEVLARAANAVVINADDPLCLSMRQHAATTNHILVARLRSNLAVAEHIATGGAAVFTAIHQGELWLALTHQQRDTMIMPLAAVPATMSGLLPHNETNALFAAALAWAHGISMEAIVRGLGSFSNSPESNPGRFNFISGYPFQVLLDYAHNPDGVSHVCEVIDKLPARRKIVVIFQIGNRSSSHIDALAPILANTFDHFIIGQDPKLVQQCADYQGDNPNRIMFEYFSASLQGQGVANDAINLAAIEQLGVEQGLALAQAGDLLVVLSEETIALPLLLRHPLRQS